MRCCRITVLHSVDTSPNHSITISNAHPHLFTHPPTNKPAYRLCKGRRTKLNIGRHAPPKKFFSGIAVNKISSLFQLTEREWARRVIFTFSISSNYQSMFYVLLVQTLDLTRYQGHFCSTTFSWARKIMYVCVV